MLPIKIKINGKHSTPIPELSMINPTYVPCTVDLVDWETMF